jgi:ABC-type microcin C transport system duplicated ATPase subunit YejF
MRDIRWKNVAIVFQGAMNALNPVFEIGEQIAEAILMHENVTEEEALDRCAKLFEMVGLDPGRIHNYPHEFSGGMRQRAMIAMALACNPDLVITRANNSSRRYNSGSDFEANAEAPERSWSVTNSNHPRLECDCRNL